MPEVMDENEIILNVYLKVHNQHIMGFSGPVDLNFQSVKLIMDMLSIKNQKHVFERVYSLYRKILKTQYDEYEREKETNK